MEINQNLLERAIFDYENHFIGICELSKNYHIPNKIIRKALEDKGYNLGKGVDPRSVVYIKRAVDEYIDILKSGKEPNIYHISQKYKVSHVSITSNLKRLNIPIVRYPKIIQFNEHIFDEINTEEKAYWLGFLSADGYIYSRYYGVGLSLAKKDAEHVRKFAKFLGCPENVKYKKSDNTHNRSCVKKKIAEFYRCDIANKHLHETLRKYGFTPTKSKDCTFLDLKYFKTLDLIRHYIRGYWDGDGSICYGKSKLKYKTVYYKHISIIGTEKMIKAILYHLNCSAAIVKNKDCNAVSFSVSGYNAQKILDYLYSDATIYLNRKYKIVKLAPKLEESDFEKLIKNGESCDANTVVTGEIKVSPAPYSVEIEPAKTE